MPAEASSDQWFVEVTEQPLDAGKYVQWVTHESAGAISTFIGTTRNTFQGRAVLHLEYEAYVPMAVAKLQDLCEQVCARWAATTKVAMAHRTGRVDVCQASVVIAVSSPHRKDALEAVHWAIDELKATVPIWKKEHFQDGSVWKENAESRMHHHQQQQQQHNDDPAAGQPAVRAADPAAIQRSELIHR